MREDMRAAGKLMLLAVPYAAWLAFAVRPRRKEASPGGVSGMRIVSMTPALTEICYELGLGESVVGVTSYCDYPPEAKEKEKIGGFANPDHERIIALKPDLVVVSPGPGNKKSVRILREFGVKVEVLRMKSVADALSAVERLGKLCGAAETAQLVRARIERDFAAVREKVRGREKPRVVLALSPPPRVYLAGGESFTGELLEIAGGLNAAEGARQDFQAYDLEQVAAMAPDVIIDASMGTQEKIRERWSVLKGVPAVESGKVHLIEPDAVVRPGPRLARGASELARLIHPEAFR